MLKRWRVLAAQKCETRRFCPVLPFSAEPAANVGIVADPHLPPDTAGISLDSANLQAITAPSDPRTISSFLRAMAGELPLLL